MGAIARRFEKGAFAHGRESGTGGLNFAELLCNATSRRRVQSRAVYCPSLRLSVAGASSSGVMRFCHNRPFARSVEVFGNGCSMSPARCCEWPPARRRRPRTSLGSHTNAMALVWGAGSARIKTRHPVTLVPLSLSAARKGGRFRGAASCASRKVCEEGGRRGERGEEAIQSGGLRAGLRLPRRNGRGSRREQMGAALLRAEQRFSSALTGGLRGPQQLRL